MYIYTIKDNDEPATGDVLAFLEANAIKLSSRMTEVSQYAPIKEQRQEWRDEINSIESMV